MFKGATFQKVFCYPCVDDWSCELQLVMRCFHQSRMIWKEKYLFLLWKRRLQSSSYLNWTGTRLLSSNESSKRKGEEEASSDWFNTEMEGDIDQRIVPKPVSVMPDHLPQMRKRITQKPWWKFRYFVDINTLPIDTEEYTKEPQYPPIVHPQGLKKQIRLEWYDAIRRLPTAQQKIYEITKHYQHLSYIIEPVMKSYNLLPVQQFITRTHLIRELPKSYVGQDLNLDESFKQVFLSSISNRLMSKTRFANNMFKITQLSQFGLTKEENYIQSTIEEDILTDMIHHVRSFYNSHTHLHNIHIDYNPYVGTSWWLNNYPIPFKKKKWFPNDTMDQCFTYKSTHCLHIRSENPLSEIVPLNHDLCTNSEIAKHDYPLLPLGVPLRRHNLLALPGFWPDHSSGFDFPNLICHSREALRQRKEANKVEYQDDQDILDGMAILSSFAWLTSVANNLGFSLYDQLTYPLVTKVIITDGQHWSFYVYQLNQHSLHGDTYNPNLCNLCWSSGDMKLFDHFENGTFVGLNDNVLKTIVQFMLVAPQENVNFELRPYLGIDERSQQDIDELSYSLRRKFANASDHYIARRKKVNLWETIYKNHKDSPLDVKRIRPKLTFKYPPFFT